MSAPGFAAEIKPLFREDDRDAMLGLFDLWSYEDVVKHSKSILAAVQSGTMPCDGAWPQEHIDLLQRWVAGGMAP